jgi:Raf kinase inhibitor-like YbhB/YbcL family protein
MELKSEAFEQGGVIPRRFSCEGEDCSPPLSWSGVPPEARSLVLICEDPDAPLQTFVHWVLYDLPPTLTQLTEDVPTEPALSSGAKQGKNSFGGVGYGGPCPPTGPYHRYFFTLYAVDRPLGLEAGAKKSDVDKAMEGRVLAMAQVMGRYRKIKLGAVGRILFRR